MSADMHDHRWDSPCDVSHHTLNGVCVTCQYQNRTT